MNAVTKVLDKVLSGAAVLLFTLLVIVVVWQVFSRQVLASPAAWTEELSRYLFVWLGLFAAALVFSERGHIAVDFVARRTNPGAQRAIAALVQVAVLVFALAVLVYGGIRVAQGAWNQNLSALPVTLGQMYVAMPVTGVLIAVYSLANLLDVIAGRTDPFPADEETADALDEAAEIGSEMDDEPDDGAVDGPAGSRRQEPPGDVQDVRKPNGRN